MKMVNEQSIPWLVSAHAPLSSPWTLRWIINEKDNEYLRTKNKYKHQISEAWWVSLRDYFPIPENINYTCVAFREGERKVTERESKTNPRDGEGIQGKGRRKMHGSKEKIDKSIIACVSGVCVLIPATTFRGCVEAWRKRWKEEKSSLPSESIAPLNIHQLEIVQANYQ